MIQPCIQHWYHWYATTHQNKHGGGKRKNWNYRKFSVDLVWIKYYGYCAGNKAFSTLEISKILSLAIVRIPSAVQIWVGSLYQPQHAPDSWLAILRSVTDEERICTSPLSKNMRPSVTYLSCESRVFPSGFLMVKFSTYFSRGSSREPILPSSHSLYSISVGKIFDTLAILERQWETAVGWMSGSYYSCSGLC